jgi:c-di-AMP phosphodiesterase-like protein
MAACQLKNETLEGAKKRLTDVIDEYMNNSNT